MENECAFEMRENMDAMSYTNQDEEFQEEDEDGNNLDEAEKYKQMREDAQWPDEVETPSDVPARERFQKYRGLKSFRHFLKIVFE